MSKHYVTLLFTGIMLTLAACQSNIAAPVYPQITFTNTRPFTFGIASVEVVQEYRAPLNTPNVEHLFLITPIQAVKIWTKDRIVAKGNKRTMRVVIKDASVTEQALEKTTGFQGLFTKDQSANYTARLDVRIEVFGDDPLFPESQASISVTRSKTIGEDASVNDRNALFYELTRDLIDSFNKEAEKNIPIYLYKYLII